MKIDTTMIRRLIYELDDGDWNFQEYLWIREQPMGGDTMMQIIKNKATKLFFGRYVYYRESIDNRFSDWFLVKEVPNYFVLLNPNDLVLPTFDRIETP